MPLINASQNGVTAFRGAAAKSQYDASVTDQPGRIRFSNAAVSNFLFMLGTVQLTDQQEFYIPEEERNSLARVHRATPTSKHAEIRFEGSMQFERMHELFSMVAGHATGHAEAVPTAPVGASGLSAGLLAPLYGNRDISELLAAAAATNPGAYRWIWKPLMDSATVPEIYTWFYGDNAQFYRMQDTIAKSMDLRYEMNTAVMQSMELFGKSVVPMDLPATPQDLVHDAVSQLTDVFITDISLGAAALMGRFDDATFEIAALSSPVVARTAPVDPVNGLSVSGEFKGSGLDKKDGLLSAANITMPSGFEMTRYSSGDLEFSDYSQMVRSLDIEFTMRHSNAGRDELARYRADTDRGRFVRLVTKGPTFQSVVGGTKTKLEALTPTPLSDGTTIDEFTVGDAVKWFYAIDASILYNEPPQLFTDYNGDDVFVLRGNSYHDPIDGWNRDFAILAQTDVGRVK